jgi:hypothetical protein
MLWLPPGAGNGFFIPFEIGLWGDVPYSTHQATIGVPALITDMNSYNLAFTVHDGEWKSGSSRCDAVVYSRGLGYLNALKAPAAYTPGDNDWTDCDRSQAGKSSTGALATAARSLKKLTHPFVLRGMPRGCPIHESCISQS